PSTEISPLSLHDALPISLPPHAMPDRARPHQPLQRPDDEQRDEGDQLEPEQIAREAVRQEAIRRLTPVGDVVRDERDRHDAEHGDRKSTRLNSSHVSISY